MKIHSFRIKNYKSIVDSGDVYPDATVTILAGKNEAGKSSLLEALEDFNTNKPIREQAKPLDQESSTPEITIKFEFSKDELNIAFDSLRITSDFVDAFKGSLSEPETISITKKYPNSYHFDWKKLSDTVEAERPVLINLLQSINAALQTTELNQRLSKRGMSNYHVSLDIITGEKALSEFAQLKVKLSHALTDADESSRASILAAVENAEATLKQFQEGIKSEKQKISESLLNIIPNFILFSSFDDVFPSSIPIKELENNPWIKDLKEMSDIDIDVIASSNSTVKKRHKHELNIKVNNEFRQFWTQDDSKLSIDWDSENLEFWIEEDGRFYPPKLRSQGRR